MFKILSLLRDLVQLRTIQWELDEDNHEMVVRIPVDDEDIEFTRQMQQLFS